MTFRQRKAKYRNSLPKRAPVGMRYIYLLTDPRPEILFCYVGCSIALQNRYSFHAGKDFYCCDWREDMWQHKILPTLTILGLVNLKDADESEEAAIKLFKKLRGEFCLNSQHCSRYRVRTFKQTKDARTTTAAS